MVIWAMIDVMIDDFCWKQLKRISVFHRRALITDAARELERSKMARFDERSGQLYVTELGRVASHFYIRHASIVTFNEQLKKHMDEARVRA